MVALLLNAAYATVDQYTKLVPSQRLTHESIFCISNPDKRDIMLHRAKLDSLQLPKHHPSRCIGSWDHYIQIERGQSTTLNHQDPSEISDNRNGRDWWTGQSDQFTDGYESVETPDTS
jgi:hypothetical protein